MQISIFYDKVEILKGGVANMIISKRIIFSKGEQRKFLLATKNKLNLSGRDMAKLCKICERSLVDWKREKIRMSYEAAIILSKKSGIKLPKKNSILEWKDHGRRIGHIGGRALFEKYGGICVNQKYRMEKWREWWESEGKYKNNPIFKRLPIKSPKKSVKLAEFVGIMIGDGGMSNNQLYITLHYKDDIDYADYVAKLIKELFSVNPSRYYRLDYSVVTLMVSRRELIDYCKYQLGLKVGNKIKQKVDIPKWIKNNKKFQIACLRGLIDTDGCIFTHKYRIADKSYSYKKLSFTSYSKPLRKSVYSFLRQNGFKPRLAMNRDVRLDSIQDLNNYFKIIGSSNPKHLRRYHE